MEWNDEALVISVRRHGETSVIATLLSRNHGRYAGLVRGGASKAKRGLFQPGNLVHARWRARLPEHLGSFTCEMIRPWAAEVLDDALRLMALSSACAVCTTILPEREPHPGVFDGLLVLLGNLDHEDWPALYVKWEVGLLADLGFGLDFSKCAATGVTEDLVYISPKSGCAVSAEAGQAYKDRLLTLPKFLLAPSPHGTDHGTDINEINAGMRLTGFFLNRHAYHENGHNQPDSRSRFVQALNNQA